MNEIATRSGGVSLATIKNKLASFEKAIKLVDSAASGKKVASQLDAIDHYYRGLGASREVLNEIQRSRFLLKAKLGSMMPRGSHSDGRGRVNPYGAVGLTLRPGFVAECRFLFEHQEAVDAYFAELGEDEEASLPKFKKIIQEQSRTEGEREHRAKLRRTRKLIADEPPDDVRQVNCWRVVLVGLEWYLGENDTDWLEDFGSTDLLSITDPKGTILGIRTMGSKTAQRRADILVDRLGFAHAPRQLVFLFADGGFEEVVIGLRGAPKFTVPDVLLRSDSVEEGFRSLVASHERDLLLELASEDEHEGYHLWGAEEADENEQARVLRARISVLEKAGQHEVAERLREELENLVGN